MGAASKVEYPVSVMQAADCSSLRSQLSEEGYDVVLVHYPNTAEGLNAGFTEAGTRLGTETEWALLTYGLESVDLTVASVILSTGKLKACVHFCPRVEDGKGLVYHRFDGTTVP